VLQKFEAFVCLYEAHAGLGRRGGFYLVGLDFIEAGAD